MGRNHLLGMAALAVWAAAGCTKRGSFLDFLGKRGGAAEPSADEQPTPLSQEQMLQQLRGLAVELAPQGAGEAPPAQPFLLCDAEAARQNLVEADGETLRVRYEAAGDACPGSWYQDAPGDVSHGVGLATFELDLWCPGAEQLFAGKALKAGAFFAHQSFDATGDAESACMGRNQGRSRYLLRSARSYGMDVTDRAEPSRKATYAFSASLTVDDGDGAPCQVRRGDDGVIQIAACTYTSRADQKQTYSFRKAERQLVVLKAVAKDLVARPGDRFFAAGTIAISVNDWQGTLRFKDGRTPPEAELSDGRKIVRARVNGAFTEALP